MKVNAEIITPKIFVETNATFEISDIFSEVPFIYVGDHRYILCKKDIEYLKDILEPEIKYLYTKQMEKGIIQ